MEFNHFVRRPFAVEAVQITAENMAEVAELVGHVRTKDGISFIALDRRIVPNVGRAYLGWWLTRLADNYRCYSPKTFKYEFIEYVKSINFTFDEDLEDEEEGEVVA